MGESPGPALPEMPLPDPSLGPGRGRPAPGAVGRRPRRSLAFYLFLLCFVLLVPVVLLSGLMLHGLFEAERERLWRAAHDRARAITIVLERDLASRIAALQALAASPELDEAVPEPSMLEGFARQARAIETLLDGSVTLLDPAGHFADPRGTAAADGDRPTLPGFLEVRADEGAPLRLVVPVSRGGRLLRALSLDMSPDWLRRQLLQARLPPGWIAVAVDRDGRLMARTERQEEFQGQRIDAALVLADEQTTLWQTRSLTGERVLVGYAVSELFGWRVGVLAPVRLVEDALYPSRTFMGAAFLLLALVAVLLALLFARRIARPVRALAEAAKALGQGRAVRLPNLPVRELNDVGAALAEASQALQRRTAALAESEARLARALKAGRIATWEWEAAGDTLTGSPGREALYGRPPGSLGDHAALLAATHPEDRPRLRATIAAALAPDGPDLYDVKFRILRPEGTVRWLRSQGAVVEREADGRPARLSGVVMDITAAQKAIEREQVLVSEVDHRARNVLTVVQSLLRMSRADDPADFAEAVRGRVGALAKAHTLLARERWSGGEWHALLHETLAAYQAGKRVLRQGPPLTLAAHSVQPLAMVLHELASNAARHGALSHDGGRVELSWFVREGRLTLLWAEHGGPALAGPPLPGFGLRLVESTIRRQLGGGVELGTAGNVLTCRISLPAERVLRDDSMPPTAFSPSEAAIARFG